MTALTLSAVRSMRSDAMTYGDDSLLADCRIVLADMYEAPLTAAERESLPAVRARVASAIAARSDRQ